MRQTVKYARVRAMQDSDRTKDNPGIYYGDNAPGAFRLEMDAWLTVFFSTRTTHGAIVAGGE
ncbi:hypothetical protein SEA_FAUST_262 [Streptomyces phage Faust]|uniref:Uncharacterized protein n=1 Tax=Streptomyces phage Faust TaxID=2767565 RepID=A0A7G9UZ79_9CAUD|nr:hypothetical protein PP456_gp025 [Streptomyces phage Faust]QNN99334.1 hypothetical protein SEA_FAUST_262 [Streptomyces phage Faust]